MTEAKAMADGSGVLGEAAAAPGSTRRKARAQPMAWIVVVSRTNQEFLAKRELEDQARKGKLGEGFEVYLPLRLSEWRGVATPKPFLPNYLFARVSNRMGDWRGVMGTRGVRGVLGVTAQRAFGLQDRIVERIKAQEESGYVRLGLAPDRVERTFEKGQAVKVDNLVEALFLEKVDARRGLILYSFFNGRDSRRVVDLRRLSETS